MMSSLAASLPAQLALADYLAQGGHERHLRRLRASLAERQQRGQRLIERRFSAGTRMTRPSGGCFTWIELQAQADGLTLHRRAMGLSINTAPGGLFSAAVSQAGISAGVSSRALPPDC
jgi:DNA-binding transcriptional MocR family regulator